MGRIKSTVIKRTAEKLVEEKPEIFSEDFEENKERIRGKLPSKRMRNMIAGYITRLKKRKRKERQKLGLETENTN